MKKIVLIAAICFLPAIGRAQSSFELTPFVGYMNGGTIRVIGPDLIRDPASTHVNVVYRQRTVKIESGTSVGLRFNKELNWGPKLLLEASIERSQSQLEDNQQLFGEAPGGPVPNGDLSFTDESITYLQGGAMWLIGQGRTAPYNIRPYVVGGVGVSVIRFHEIPLSDQTKPSINGGIGVKWGLTERLALRFETRAYLTKTSESKKSVPLVVRDCSDCVRTYSFPSTELQSGVTVGLAWKF